MGRFAKVNARENFLFRKFAKVYAREKKLFERPFCCVLVNFLFSNYEDLGVKDVKKYKINKTENMKL